MASIEAMKLILGNLVAVYEDGSSMAGREALLKAAFLMRFFAAIPTVWRCLPGVQGRSLQALGIPQQQPLLYP